MLTYANCPYLVLPNTSGKETEGKNDAEAEKEEEGDDLKTPLLFETEEPDKSKTTPKEGRRRFTFFSSRSTNVTPKRDSDCVDRD